jgi:RNA polymerase primary sigma factor
MSAANQSYGNMSAYFTEMSRHKQLSREMEVALARRARKGDAKARQKLVLCNLPLVVSVAKKFVRSGARLDDLIQEGNIGLLKAIEHYDPRKGTRFATYAVWWIRAYIQRFVKDTRSQVRGGESERGSLTDLSLDASVDEEGEVSHLDRLTEPAPDPEDRYLTTEHDRDVRNAVRKVRKRLGDVGWDILQERLSQDSPKTLEEIGKRWGISRERVRQLELRTKTFLAHYLEPLAA